MRFMGDLTEQSIFSQLSQSFRLAAECCDDLARLPAKGPTYRRLITELKLVEGCCRQASAWREDTRWLNIGLMVAEAHKRAGGWLRGYKVDGIRIKIAEGQMHPLFIKLAENLRAGFALAEQFRTKRTGRVGMILPDMLPGPHRETRQHRVQLPRTPGGVIIPSGVSLH